MAYVEYESYDHVAEAVKMMDGGKFPPQKCILKIITAVIYWWLKKSSTVIFLLIIQDKSMGKRLL